MCDPISIIAGAAMQANAQYEAAKFNSIQERRNAQLAEAQASEALAAGAVEHDRYLATVRGFLGEQRAAIAASGLDQGSVVAQTLTADTAGMGEADALILQANAAREAWGYRVDAANRRASATMARRTGAMQAGATLLTSAGNAANMFFGR